MADPRAAAKPPPALAGAPLVVRINHASTPSLMPSMPVVVPSPGGTVMLRPSPKMAAVMVTSPPHPPSEVADQEQSNGSQKISHHHKKQSCAFARLSLSRRLWYVIARSMASLNRRLRRLAGHLDNAPDAGDETGKRPVTGASARPSITFVGVL